MPDEEQEALTREVAPLVHEKLEVLADFVPMAGWFFRPLAFAPEALERLRGTAGAAETLTAAAAGLRDLGQWDVPADRDAGPRAAAALELKPKAVFAALRLGMSGQTVTPGLFESLWVLGRDKAVARLERRRRCSPDARPATPAPAVAGRFDDDGPPDGRVTRLPAATPSAGASGNNPGSGDLFPRVRGGVSLMDNVQGRCTS